MSTLICVTESANGIACTHERTDEHEIAQCKTLLSVEGIQESYEIVFNLITVRSYGENQSL